MGPTYYELWRDHGIFFYNKGSKVGPKKEILEAVTGGGGGSMKKGVLRNFLKFTGKHLCQSLFFNKVVGLRPATLIKKKLWQRCFPGNFAKFLRTSFLTEHLRWLLLDITRV